MQCLLLASQGQGYVSPNPLVGAMLVHNGEMIGAGYHQQYGTAHAEVNCFASVQPNHKHLIPDSTLYINLEPCNHQGNTPPCTDAILKQGIKTIVVGVIDNNPLVNGSGIKKLQAHGVTVITNVLAENCLALNRRFFTYQEKKRPYIILKWAETEDGFIAAADKSTLAISGPDAQKQNHLWRSQEDAILVGHNTLLIDNPQLNVRYVDGRNPVRVAFTRDTALPDHLHFLNNTQNTIIYNPSVTKQNATTAWKKAHIIEEIIFNLYEYKTQSIIIEGGAKTIQDCINKNLWDEARVIKSNKKIIEGYAAPILNSHQFLYKDAKGSDTIMYFKNTNNKYL